MSCGECCAGEPDIKYMSTTFKILGFIVCFLGAFFAFIIADETEYFGFVVALGVFLLIVTLCIFLSVMYESRPENLRESAEETEMQPILGQSEPSEPEMAQEPQPEPYWEDQNNMSLNYVRNILGLPPGDSDETLDEDENVPDADIQALENMAESGLSTDTRKNSQDKDTENCVRSVDAKSLTGSDIPFADASSDSEKGNSSSETKKQTENASSN